MRSTLIILGAEAESRSVPETQSHTRILRKTLIFGLAGLLVFAALAFGSVEEWSIFVLEAGSGALLLLWAAVQALEGSTALKRNPLYAPMLLLLLVVLVQVAFGLSAYQFETQSQALRYLAYGGLFFVASQCLETREDLQALVYVLVIAGFLIAVFAIVQGLTSNGKLYWVRKPRFGGLMYGPYVNRNHYAGLMEILTPLPLVLALRRNIAPSQRMLLAFIALVMAGSIFLSLSRGGMIAFSAEMVLLSAYLFRSQGRRQTAVVMAMACVLMIAFVVWLGSGSEIVERFAVLRQGPSADISESRLAVLKDSLRMVRERPALGWGLGTFPIVYPAYRSFYSNLFMNQAHDDYLQFLIETGVLGLAAVLWFIVVLYAVALRGMRGRELSLRTAVRLGALLGCTGILVHSTMDFNLQIPANAALFYVSCALATHVVNTNSNRLWAARVTRPRQP